MYIQLQASSLFFLLLLLYFYKRHGDLGLYLGKLFLYVLYSWIVCLSCDIFSIILIVKQDSFPPWFVHFGCKAYCVSLVIGVFFAFSYVNADASKLAKADKTTYALIAVAAIFSIVIFMVPIYIMYDGSRTLYSYGPATIATYAVAVPIVLAIVLKLIIQGKAMNPKRRLAMEVWIGIWIVAVIVQFFNNEMLLVGFAGAIGIIILFFALENPENYIDRGSEFFNNYAFSEFLKQNDRANKEICGMLLSLEDSYGKKFSMVMDSVMDEVILFLKKLQEARIFRTDDKEFFLAFDNSEEFEQTCDLIFERFEKSWLEGEHSDLDGEEIFLQPYYLLIPSASLTKSADEFLGMLKYFRLQFSAAQENHVLILDEKFILHKQERDEMIETIRLAIKEDRVEVFYQPIYSVSSKKFVSAEALVRIRREDGSIIPPGLFIPIAEETGLVAKIGEIVFEKTCYFLKETEIISYGIEYIEINLSVVQCENRYLAKTYMEIMDKCGINSRYVNLEITESAAISRKDILIENMETLIQYGVTFSLDDFGSGQSNLNYIVDMPVEVVKFDRDMIQAYFNTPKASFIVQAAVDMIHKLNLKVVAEGVETAEQLEALSRLGIDYIQGYYFSKPIEADKFLEFVKEKNRC